jgi:hypothetical protein
LVTIFDLVFLGWFKTSKSSLLDTNSTSFDIINQLAFQKYNETAICLVMDPEAKD